MSERTPINSDVVIFDTSCLILLSKIEEIELLNRLWTTTVITSIVYHEFGKQIPDWLQIKEPSDKHYQEILELDLDPGEASSIALTLETENAILLIDDLKGRQLAEKLSIRYSGTFGLILQAKQEGLIDQIRPIIDKVRNTNFRFSEQLLQTVLDEAGE